MVFCHGAGFSGLSFAQTVRALRSVARTGDLGFAAVDARGHGACLVFFLFHARFLCADAERARRTGKTKGGDESAMSLDQLAQDLVSVLKEMFPDPDQAPKLLLVGHSMVRAKLSCPPCLACFDW